jgi:hypothetical protein
MAFKRLDSEDFLLSADSITATLWTGYLPTLNQFFTSSIQEASPAGTYYLSVYQTASALYNAEVQFDLAYGDREGSGSTYYDPAVIGVSPTRTIYGQYRNLVLGDENANFVFGNITASNFYVINIERNRYKESLFPGSTTLLLTNGGTTISLTDNSKVATTNVFTDAGRLYNLVSGSSGTVYTGVNSNGWAGGTNAASGSYGWFLPDIGILMLNPLALGAVAADGGIGLTANRTNNSNGLNNRAIYNAINSAGSFTLNSQETITSDYIFVRARNAEFNYSENPSFISGSTGAVLFNSFINNPQTFITTVGLYNDANELLAVAKLSKPFKKDFTKEMLLRVKLDF